jgi:dethiobiotin synthetase
MEPAAAANIDQLPPPDPANLSWCFDEIAASADAMLVETASTLSSSLTWGFDFADLAAMLDLEVLLVAGNRAGCLNSTAVTLGFAESKRLRMAGVILCDVEPAESSIARVDEAAMRRVAPAQFLGRMRYREPLAKKIVEQLLLTAM